MNKHEALLLIKEQLDNPHNNRGGDKIVISAQACRELVRQTETTVNTDCRTVPAYRETLERAANILEKEAVSIKDCCVDRETGEVDWDNDCVEEEYTAMVGTVAELRDMVSAISTGPQLVGDLSMLVRKLVQALQKASPGSDLPDKTLDYLRRKGLQGNPLRET